MLFRSGPRGPGHRALSRSGHPKARSPDAAQDELALHLALLHRVLVLAGHLGDLLGDVGLALINSDEAFPVKTSLPLQTPSLRSLARRMAVCSVSAKSTNRRA